MPCDTLKRHASPPNIELVELASGGEGVKGRVGHIGIREPETPERRSGREPSHSMVGHRGRVQRDRAQPFQGREVTKLIVGDVRAIKNQALQTRALAQWLKRRSAASACAESLERAESAHERKGCECRQVQREVRQRRKCNEAPPRTRSRGSRARASTRSSSIRRAPARSIARRDDVDLRTAATLNSIGKIAATYRDLGIFP